MGLGPRLGVEDTPPVAPVCFGEVTRDGPAVEAVLALDVIDARFRRDERRLEALTNALTDIAPFFFFLRSEYTVTPIIKHKTTPPNTPPIMYHRVFKSPESGESGCGVTAHPGSV